MKRPLYILAVAALASAALSAADAPATEPAVGTPAIVLELYTSQGCYSCPPADRLLAKLGDEASAHGRQLVPLAFHVDYWNYIGWTDPFSSADWSARQRRYRRALRQRSVYTPQLVIDGWRQCVGSDERTVRREIERAAREAAATTVDLQLTEDGQRRLRVEIEAELGATVDAELLEIFFVVFQNGLVTTVPRGENANKTLENEYVVRRMDRAAIVAAMPGGTHSLTVTTELANDWKRDELGVAVFLQDPDTLRIYGASAAQLRDSS